MTRRIAAALLVSVLSGVATARAEKISLICKGTLTSEYSGISPSTTKLDEKSVIIDLKKEGLVTGEGGNILKGPLTGAIVEINEYMIKWEMGKDSWGHIDRLTGKAEQISLFWRSETDSVLYRTELICRPAKAQF